MGGDRRDPLAQHLGRLRGATVRPGVDDDESAAAGRGEVRGPLEDDTARRRDVDADDDRPVLRRGCLRAGSADDGHRALGALKQLEHRRAGDRPR